MKKNTMTNEEMGKRLVKMGKGLKTMLDTMTEDEILEMFKEATQEYCMGSLKEKDRDLNLSRHCKKCYDYLAEQFILGYIGGKSVATVIEDNVNGKFYNTWLAFLGIVYIIITEVTAKSIDIREYKGIENIIDDSGISRKTWIEFLYQLYENGYFDK